MTNSSVVIRLTPKQAELVYMNVDGWMDAGSGEEGLAPDERDALDELSRQILASPHGPFKRVHRAMRRTRSSGPDEG